MTLVVLEARPLSSTALILQATTVAMAKMLVSHVKVYMPPIFYIYSIGTCSDLIMCFCICEMQLAALKVIFDWLVVPQN